MKDPKTALYVTGGLLVLMGVWGLAVAMGWVGAFNGVTDPWWHAVLKVVVGGWALWVANQK